MLQVGETAPLFTANSTEGTIRLQDYLGKSYVLLVFYPGDDTPICTKQLCSIQDSYVEFQHENTFVLGINPAELSSHRQFADKFGYRFPIVQDEGEEIRKRYDVKKIIGLFAQQRIVYIVAPSGRIIYAKKGNPSTAELLARIKSHQE